MDAALTRRWCTSEDDLDPDLFEAVVACWLRVSNDGGAVGFPFLPVAEAEVRRAATTMRSALGDDCRLLATCFDESLVGWLLLRRNESPLTLHWATLSRVQTDLPYRGKGYGAGLVREAERAAREDLGLEQLHVEVRAGQGLEGFYSRLGWRVVGRWPGALRLAADDTRDEVLLLRDLNAS